MNRVYLDDRTIDAEVSSDTSDYLPERNQRSKNFSLKEVEHYFILYITEIKKDFNRCLTNVLNQFRKHYDLFLDEQIYSQKGEEESIVPVLRNLKPDIERFQEKYNILKGALPLQSKKKKSKIQDNRKTKLIDIIDKILNSHSMCKTSIETTGTTETISKVIFDDQMSKIQQLYDQQRYSQVIKQIKELSHKKSLPQLHFMTGNCLKAMGMTRQAIVEFGKSIEHVHRGCYYNNRGNCFLSLSMLRNAYEDYHKAMELQPDNPIFSGNCGSVCIGLKIYDEAIKCYNLAIGVDPNKDSFYNNRAFAKIRLQKFDQAIEDYDRAIDLNPLEHIYLKNRANLYIDKKRYKTAISDLIHAIQLEPRKHEYYYLLAKCQYLTGQVASSLASIRKAIEYNSQKQSYLDFFNAVKNELGYQ